MRWDFDFGCIDAICLESQTSCCRSIDSLSLFTVAFGISTRAASWHRVPRRVAIIGLPSSHPMSPVTSGMLRSLRRPAGGLRRSGSATRAMHGAFTIGLKQSATDLVTCGVEKRRPLDSMLALTQASLRSDQSSPMIASISLRMCVGAPDRIRTCDLCLRRAALYPAELRVPERSL